MSVCACVLCDTVGIYNVCGSIVWKKVHLATYLGVTGKEQGDTDIDNVSVFTESGMVAISKRW